MTENKPGAADYQYAPPERKSRKLWWIVGGIVLALVLLGTCVRGGVSLFQALSDRSEASRDFAERVMEEGVPPPDDPIYSRRLDVTQAEIDEVDRYIRSFGQVTEYGVPGCNMRTSADIDKDKSGTFADCTLTIETEQSPGIVTIDWVKDDAVWKVLGLNVWFSDESVLADQADPADTQAEDPSAPAETDTE
ncbi:hypothetical protein HY29_14920 [Hyphomonas beringensis]|uniref:DUF4878 domain-containing protein n=1 Tax=Hyphomonas beringensis TaxID=1280946 RepID=A0A062U1W8_9PROT|nr:hypothetical protein [Hyphomonas beringensis]KCZ54326.1 hypothetical protein HY29_14920 [Hyphomonas beringensis]